MELPPFTLESLRECLENGCDCEYQGKEIARPYADPDEMPDIFRSPDGKYFSVPEPDNEDGTYSDYLVGKIFEVNNLSPRAWLLKTANVSDS